MHVDRSRRDTLGAYSPDVRQQFVARDGPIGVAGQVIGQLQLAFGQLVAATVVEPDLASVEIDPPAGDRDLSDIGRPLGRASQDGLDSSEQLLHAEGLDHVIVGPVAQPADPIRLVAPSGEDDDRQGRPQTPDFGEYLHPIATGQYQVEQQEIELPLQGHIEPRLAVARLEHVVAGEPQRIDDPPPDRRVVFDREDSFFAHSICHKVQSGASILKHNVRQASGNTRNRLSG